MIMPVEFEATATDEQLAIWDWWDDPQNEPSNLFKCHTFSASKAEIGHPEHARCLQEQGYWAAFFGISRQGEKKGLGRILLPGSSA